MPSDRIINAFRAPRAGIVSVLLASVLACWVAGCDRKAPEDLTASAKQYLANNDTRAALIQLRTALQQNPDAAEARYLFGKALLGAGNASAAVVELDKARALGHADIEVLPLLAEALIASGQPKKVTDTFAAMSLNEPRANAQLKARVAEAYAAQNEVARSKAMVDAALQSDPRNVAATLLRARLLAGGGAVNEAMALVDGLIAADARQAAAWTLKGELLWTGKSDIAAAKQAFRQSLAIDSQQMRAHVSLITIGAMSNDAPAYKAQIAEMAKANPDNFVSRFFVVQLAMIEGDLKKAQDGAQQLLKMAPDYAPALQLAGAVELQLGALAMAQRHLIQTLQVEPNAVGAPQLLAQAYLRSGQPGRAISTLQSLLVNKNAKPTADVLGLVAEAYAQEGDHDKAERYYALAAQTNPDDLKPRVALALAQINKGDVGGGLVQLETMAAKDPSAFADLALVNALMKRRDDAAALKAIDRLLGKTPNKALAYQLQARTLFAGGDAVAARASLEKAIAADPVYYPAIADLANLDLAQNRPADARKRFEALLARNPDDYRALLALADVQQRNGGKPEDVEALLTRAVRSRPDEPAPRLVLVRHHLELRHAKAALAAAEEAVAALPNSPEVQDALGRSQMAAGDPLRAMQTFQNIASAQPNEPMPHLRLADIYLARKDYDAAIESLNRALRISPRFVLVQRKLVQVLVSRKQPAEAIKVARQVQAQRPNEAIGYLIEGEIDLTQRQWGPAVDAFMAALKRERTSEVARRMHSLFILAGRERDAERFAADWLKEHPADTDFTLHLASLEMDRKNFSAAEALFRQVLTRRPDDASTLNNIAWLLLMQQRPGALQMVEKAVSLAPERPEMMDTMATVLEAEKQLSKAIEWQRKAVAKAPGLPIYRLHLAKLLIAGGDKPQARTELEALSALGPRFAEQGEVATLLKSL